MIVIQCQANIPHRRAGSGRAERIQHTGQDAFNRRRLGRLQQRKRRRPDARGKGVEGGISAGIEGGTGPVELGQVFLTSQLDDPAQRISGPDPRYPPVLQSAGIAGSVDLQFIVDTTGHVEPNSLKVLAKTHDAFVEPAKEAVMKGVYKPARYKGEPVRQQVQQRIKFQTN